MTNTASAVSQGAPARIPLFKVAMSPDAADRVTAVLESGYIGQGPRVDEFEDVLGRQLGTSNVVTVNSATSGLHLLLYMLKERPEGAGFEVLSSPMTCTASNWPVIANGLRLRWVDVDPRTLNIDLDDLARKINADTRVIIVVHWAGYPVDLVKLDHVLDDAERLYGHRPVVIEDCAHAWGSRLDGRLIGTHGNEAVFSFQAIKHLTTGDGGLLVSGDDAFSARARRLRWYGMDRTLGQSFRCEHDVAEIGFKFHMNDINAVIGLANLDLANANVRRHQENAEFYDRELDGVPGVELLARSERFESAAWIYTLLVDDRPGFIAHLDSLGIEANPVHARNDIHTCVAEYRALLPGLDTVADRMVSIPVGWWLTPEDRDRVVSAVRQGW